MIEFRNGGRLVESVSELPDVLFDELYLDFETSSGDPECDSLDPWDEDHCSIAGAAFTGDRCPHAWYVPRKFLKQQYLQRLISHAKRWINSNVKYDAHVAMNDMLIEFPECELVDTVSRAKLIDSDRTTKGGYGLKVLSAEWCGVDISKYGNRMYPYLEGADNKDYGRVPVDIIGEYACQDALSVRDVNDYIDAHMPDQTKALDRTEIATTKTLFAMERRGLRIKPERLKLRRVESMTTMVEASERIQHKLGYIMDPSSPDDCFDLLCNRYGMPVLKRTKANAETGGGNNPSFDVKVLRQYKGFVGAPKDIIDDIILYRHHKTLDSLFWQSWLEKENAGYIHPSINQSVRSGRMSSYNPNSHQLSGDAKEEIYPREGYSLISMDYSQIEFRIIVHYIKNQKAIDAYNNDPKTDFHTFVSQICGIKRRPAKTINLGKGYGMGKKKLLLSLSHDADLIEGGMTREQAIALAESANERWHAEFPELQPTMREANRAARYRGYVFNLHGRRLHLPLERSWVAFNRICQSEAADLAKERANVVSPVYDEWLRERDVHLLAIVHDEFVWECPTALVPEVEPYLRLRLENPAIPYRVPIKVESHASSVNWRIASKCEAGKPICDLHRPRAVEA